MEKSIKVQIHNYDTLGNYRIVEEKQVSRSELLSLRKEARNSVPSSPFKNFPDFYKHIVYYADIRQSDAEDEGISFAGIYMYGMAVSDYQLADIVKNTGGGYIGAYHRKD